MKQVMILMVLFGFGFNAFSQTLDDEPWEKLRTKLHQSRPDTGRITLLLALSKKFILKSGTDAKDIDSSYRLMAQAQTLGKSLKDMRSQGLCLLMAALIANKKGDTNNGLKISQQALSVFKKIGASRDEAEADIIIGQHYNPDGQDRNLRIDYYKKAIRIFQNLNLKEREATTLVDLAELQIIENQNDEPIKNLKMALTIYQSISYKKVQRLYSLLEQDYGSGNDVVNALKYGLLAVKAAESQRDTTLGLCSIYFNVAVNYSYFVDYGECYQYLKKAMSIARKYNDESSIDIIGQSIVNVMNKSSRYKESLSLLKTMSSMSIYRNADRKAGLYYSILNVYVKSGDLQSANIYYNKLKSLSFEKLTAVDGKLKSNTLSNYFLSLGQYKLSYVYIKEFDDLAKQKKSWANLSTAQLFWFKADSGLARYKSAIKHYQLFKAYADSNFNNLKQKQTSLLQVQFETEKNANALQLQAKSILLLKKQSQLRQVQLQQARGRIYWILAGSILLLFTLGLVYSRYRLKRRNNEQLEAKQIEIYHQNLILQNLVTEKDWLLKEVHHRVKNNLQIVMSLLSTQSAYLQNIDALEAIKESQNRVQTISLIHQKLYSGNDIACIDMSVYVADLVNYLVEAFDTKSRHINFELLVEPITVDLAQAVPLGLILNEAITNAIKYAFKENGGDIIVALQALGQDIVLLTISDNGKGLPENFEINKAGSLGMEMMKALSARLEGIFEIKSKAGTTVSVEFQLEKVLSVGASDPLLFT
jgi:two-component sensor histidine kinase